MAFEGDANQIGKVSVGIEANVDALRQGLEQAKQEATQKAAEIQQSLKINPLGYDTTPERTGPSGAAAAAYGYGTTPSQMAEMTRQTDNQTRATRSLGDSFKDTAGQLALLTAEFGQYLNLGKTIGDAFFEGARQAIELETAVNRANIALEKSLELSRQIQQARVGGNANVSDTQSERVDILDKEIMAIQQKLAQDYSLTDVLQNQATYIPAFRLLGFETNREQLQAELEEKNRERAREAERRDAIRNREEARSTLGGVAAEVAGLAPGSLPPIEKLSPAQAAFMRKSLADNPDYLEQLIYWNKLGYNAQQQQLIEMMNGNRQVDYR